MNKFFISLFAALALCACDNSVDISPEGGDIDSAPLPEVTVLYSSNAMGDVGYNDLICAGVYRAQLEENFLINTLVPDSLEEGKQLLINWLEADHSSGRHLLLVTSDEYEDIFREKAREVPDNDKCKVIFLESKSDDLPTYSFYISLYGVSFVAGALAAKIAEQSDQVLIIRANSENQIISDAAKGFSDGFRNFSDGEIVDVSIADVAGQGFTVAEIIYKFCNLGIFDNYRVVFPLIGGSINGLFRYYSETLTSDQLWVIGVDTDKAGYSFNVPFSIVKHVDVAVKSYILDWLHGAPLPRYQRLGLRSGHTDFVEGWWNDYDPDFLEKLKSDAIRLEDEFEER